MTMFVRVLLFTCACALSAAEVPQYGDIADSILKANKIVVDNILSMDGNVPLLNDPRRQYAEIIHVVSTVAMQETVCIDYDYYGEYQKEINRAAPDAIANPQDVIVGTKKVIQDIIDSIEEVLQLIKAKTQAMADRNQQNIDEAIDEEINNNIEKYGTPRSILLAVGIFATQLNNNHERYYAVETQDLTAHRFIINGVQKLEKHVMAGSNLYKVLYGHTSPHSHCD